MPNDPYQSSLKQSVGQWKLKRLLFKLLGQKEDYLEYSFKDVFKYTFCICLRKRLRQQDRRHEKFIASYDKVKEELDLVAYVRNQRYLLNLVKALLSDREQRLLFMGR